eukprot:s1830_g4.t1
MSNLRPCFSPCRDESIKSFDPAQFLFATIPLSRWFNTSLAKFFQLRGGSSHESEVVCFGMNGQFRG